MINIENLVNYYPESLQKDEFRMSILKEYLQYKTLSIIYNGQWGKNLIFIGGTCLRFIHYFRRFSDDLDFDIHGRHTRDDHKEMCKYICKELSKEGIVAEIDKEKKTRNESDMITSYINFPGLLFLQKIDRNPDKKLFIKIDAQYQNTGKYRYKPEAKLINKFEVVRMVNAAPLSVLYSMKLCALISRTKGRDFYDIMDLVNLTKPDNDFLLNRLANMKNPVQLSSSEQLKKMILNNLEKVNWKEKISEVSAFLHDKQEIEKVKYFKDYIIQIDSAKMLPDFNIAN
ncbi:MAG: nucleotidyl transferase AbiEii/AbiGii toxin family protein [Bacteroidetes bacterium]|nr:nucleotidyl transferase AbiEii/AbiGii toxin family protein [Bacteroidota bacterium]